MVMLGGIKEIPPIVKLIYKAGDLILKEGDYGLSIYKIIKGTVEISSQSQDRDILLTHLGPGEVFGEMAFLSMGGHSRSASARAVGDVVLEAWHPNLIAKQYDQMPLIIKHIANEALKRLVRMNKLVSQLSAQKEEGEQEEASEQTPPEKRRHYRKKIDLECSYSPADVHPRPHLKGIIKDISMSGMKMEVRIKAGANFPYDPGDEFLVEARLPNGRDLKLTARILYLKEPRIPTILSLGMVFTSMREGSEKELGFLLMP